MNQLRLNHPPLPPCPTYGVFVRSKMREVVAFTKAAGLKADVAKKVRQHFRSVMHPLVYPEWLIAIVDRLMLYLFIDSWTD